VFLANNHALDFGESECKSTVKLFKDNGFRTLGAGSNVDEAEQPLLFSMGKRKLILFNAYWFRNTRHAISRHYALGDNAGTACLSDAFFDKVSYYRKKYPGAFIILSPHWGTDFAQPLKVQKSLAEKCIRAGADMVLGHGAHIVSGQEWVDGKMVLYSIGNFVFNSNGTDFNKKDKLPYGYVAKLYIWPQKTELRLYPVMVNNRISFWQPFPVTEEQAGELTEAYAIGAECVRKSEDGFYFVFELK
jgi:poly-gamma-glutamate capsule biosynthesis protein CapA/YwtB (metallophosphatase superfamily)